MCIEYIIIISTSCIQGISYQAKLPTRFYKFKAFKEDSKIKTHGSESRGQEEAACMRVFWPTQPLQ